MDGVTAGKRGRLQLVLGQCPHDGTHLEAALSVPPNEMLASEYLDHVRGPLVLVKPPPVQLAYET